VGRWQDVLTRTHRCRRRTLPRSQRSPNAEGRPRRTLRSKIVLPPRKYAHGTEALGRTPVLYAWKKGSDQGGQPFSPWSQRKHRTARAANSTVVARTTVTDSHVGCTGSPCGVSPTSRSAKKVVGSRSRTFWTGSGSSARGRTKPLRKNGTICTTTLTFHAISALGNTPPSRYPTEPNRATPSSATPNRAGTADGSAKPSTAPVMIRSVTWTSTNPRRAGTWDRTK